MQMVLWSIVAGGQFWLSGRRSFLATRALLAILQVGFIPDTGMTVADTLSALMGAGFLQMCGVLDYAGWRWLFLIEETIIVNRVLREDPSKSEMHNRQPITPKLLWKCLKDYDLWPLYIIGLVFQIPMVLESQYLALSLRQMNFNTFASNLLSIPNTVIHSE
ncbi:hypothetical protein AAE478_010303 [Parahypoxylon ruwenzoriense]